MPPPSPNNTSSSQPRLLHLEGVTSCIQNATPQTSTPDRTGDFWRQRMTCFCLAAHVSDTRCFNEQGTPAWYRDISTWYKMLGRLSRDNWAIFLLWSFPAGVPAAVAGAQASAGPKHAKLPKHVPLQSWIWPTSLWDRINIYSLNEPERTRLSVKALPVILGHQLLFKTILCKKKKKIIFFFQFSKYRNFQTTMFFIYFCGFKYV